MATIRQLPSGRWQVQIRLKGRKASETFIRRDHARAWATQAEAQVDRGLAPSGRRARSAKTFGGLIDLHIDDMTEVGKPPRRSKSATLEMLRRELGALRIPDMDRERLIRFGRDRAKQGAGPVTLGQDIGAIKLVMAHAAAVHGLEVSVEPVQMARIALKRLGLIGKGRERDRRPTEDELKKLFAHFDGNLRQHHSDEPDHQIRDCHRHAPGRNLPGNVERSQSANEDADDPRPKGSAREEGQRPAHSASGGLRLRRHGVDRRAALNPEQRK